ncbi:MAG: CPBP family intramembrane metalloprotease [Acetatifactor sp.]|nr:CPBP family intramembrane metalloprotease [Acetatifactor sp.]
MKNLLKQLGKVTCYLLLFFGMQLLIGILGSIVYGVVIGVQSGLNGEMIDQITATQMTEEFLLSNQVLLVFISDVLCVLFLMAFFGIRKKKWYREANIKNIQKTEIPYLVVMGLGMALLVDGVLNLLPASVLEEYEEASGALFQNMTAFSILFGVVVAPIAEEIFFRGIILSRLRRAMPVTVAVLLSSLLFGVGHLQPLWMTYTFVIGCIWAVAAVKTDSIISSIIMHSIFNACGELLSMSNMESDTLTCILFAIVGGVLMTGTVMIYFSNKPKDEQLENAI